MRYEIFLFDGSAYVRADVSWTADDARMNILQHAFFNSLEHNGFSLERNACTFEPATDGGFKVAQDGAPYAFVMAFES